jgi:hypothetical protein
MKKLIFLVISMSFFSSCNKNDFYYDIEDVKITIGDSVNVKIKKLDLKIETDETYNIDVNNDGFTDFALIGSYSYSSDWNKGSYWHWSVKVLSGNSKVLCDTISEFKESFFFAPKPLLIKDTFSVAQGLWLISSDQSGEPGPYGSTSYRPSGDFFLFSDSESYYRPPTPGEAKGGITLEEYRTINEKYIGIQSEKNGIVTMGWMRLKHNNREVILNEIGTADFPIEEQQP